MTTSRINRRAALKRMATAGLAAPFVFRATAGAAPSETVHHASFGANGQALSDIKALTAGKHLKLVAVAEVDLARAAEVKKLFPDVTVYQDWRELLDKEKGLDSVNVTTPDHMHAPITMRAMQQGLNVYTQKPLTQTIYETRQLTKAAKDKKLVTQMGIQIHSYSDHKMVVVLVQAGAIGKVKEVHSWSGKGWGDKNPRPDRSDPVPPELNWDDWLGVAAERPFIKGYYHPAEWRKRLDFGSGTFGDMGCHILDPVFGSLALTAPTTVRSEAEGPNADSWPLEAQVKFEFPGTKYTTETLTLNWYHGGRRPPVEVVKQIGDHKLQRPGVDLPRHGRRSLLAVHRRTDSAAGRQVQGLQGPESGRRRPLPAIRRGGARQRQDVGAVRVFRPADGGGAAGLPVHALPEDDAGMERGRHENHEREGGRCVRAEAVPQGVGGGGVVSGEPGA